jgi:hypothetical protein
VRALLLLAAVVGGGCVDHVAPVDYGDPTSYHSPTTAFGITAYVVAPRVTDKLDASQVDLVMAAWAPGDTRPLRVTVSVDQGPSVLAAAQPGGGAEPRYTSRLALLHGDNHIRVRLATPDGAHIRFFDYRLRYAGAGPGLRLSLYAAAPGSVAGSPCVGDPIVTSVTAALAVCVRGQVSTSDGKVGALPVQLQTLRGQATAAPATDATGRFEATLDLTANTDETVQASVTHGGSTSATLAVAQDLLPPTVAIDHADAAIDTDADAVTLTGSAGDEHGLAALRLESSSGGALALDLTSPWSGKVQLEPGDNTFTAVARDLAGNEARASVQVVRDRSLLLRAQNAGAGATEIALDRAGFETLISNPADQQGIELVRLPLRPSILRALDAIRDPVAGGVDTTAWGAAEWNLWKLINMTPDTADLRGTSVEKLLALADAIGIPKARVLADSFAIGVTTPVVRLEVLADVLIEQLISTHPNMHDASGAVFTDENGDVALPVTAYDALRDLTTLAPRFGPSGSHPGFLTGTSSSQVFEPGFLITLPVRSNLTQYDGVSAGGSATLPGAAKDYIFLLKGDKVLELDFLSDRFSAVGFVDEPTIDLTFLITEHATPGCTNQPCTLAGTTPQTGTGAPLYRGNSPVWTEVPPWQGENIVAEVAYRGFRDTFAPSYQNDLSYDAGSIMDAATLHWDRGWISVVTKAGLGDPPPPLYAWDLLSEVAQVRLHDGGIAEGAAATRFTLNKLPIGLTADQLIAKIRPSLQARQAQLSAALIGTRGLATSGVDLFLVRDAQSGTNQLVFRGPSDGADASSGPPPYPYTRPGFFADAALSQAVDQVGAVPGAVDSAARHYVAVSGPGQALYFKAPDAQGVERVYLLGVKEQSAAGVTVTIRPVTP